MSDTKPTAAELSAMAKELRAWALGSGGERLSDLTCMEAADVLDSVAEKDSSLTDLLELVAANRLMLGHAAGPRHVAKLEDAARKALGR